MTEAEASALTFVFVHTLPNKTIGRQFPGTLSGVKVFLACVVLSGSELGAVSDTSTGQVGQPQGDAMKQPIHIQLQVTYVETIKPLGGSGGLIITRRAGESLVKDSKNKYIKAFAFPISAGTNAFERHLPNGLDLTMHLDRKDSASDETNNLIVKLEWVNANGGPVTYSIEFKTSLHLEDTYLITAPWKGKNDSNILIALSQIPGR